MYELKAGAFYHAATRIAETAAWVGATTRAASGEETSGRLFHGNEALDEMSRLYVGMRFTGVQEYLTVLGASVTALAVADAQEELSYDSATWATARERLEDVRNTLRRELSLRTVLVLEPKEQALYAPSEPHFGPDVTAKFPTEGVFEIDEAGKCLALGRSTAAVFHLMRVMEIGLSAVSECLQIENPVKQDRSWGAILRLIKDDMAARSRPKTPARPWSSKSADQALFESLYGSLDAVKVAWRNPTMHVEKKYLPDEAEHIFVSVRGFMKTLASRCDESGLPHA